MEEALRALLRANAGVISAAGGKVEWSAQPQGAVAPYITLHRIGGNRSQHLQGPDGMIESRVQVDCWGPTYASAKTAARAAIAVLNGYRSGLIRRVFVESERDDHDLTPPDPLYRTSVDLLIAHQA